MSKFKKHVEQQTEQKTTGARPASRLRRDFRYGTNAIVLIAAVLVVFVLVNLVMEQFSQVLTLDLTKEKLYSIGEITDKHMKALKEDVEIIALYDETQAKSSGNTRAEVVKVLQLYDEYDRVTVTFKDPDSNPGFIRDQVGETEAASYSEGDYIVKCGDQSRRIAEDEMFVYETVNYIYREKSALQVEQKLTSAILFVTSEDYPVIYCATGHGEVSYSKFTKVFNRIAQEGCDVQELDLTQAEAIPEDAAVLIFLSPRYDLTSSEHSMVEQWLKQDGGQLIVCADEDESWTPLTRFNQLLEENFGLRINSDVLQETDKNYKIAAAKNDKAFIGTSVSKGPLANSYVAPVYLFATRSISVLSVDASSTGIENYAIMNTMESAKAVSGLDQSEKQGVHAVAAAAVNTKNGGHCAVYGSSLGLSDEYLEEYGSPVSSAMSIFVMSVDWMIDEYNQNEGNQIDAKAYDSAKVALDEGKSNLLAICAIVVVPVLIIGVGVVVWLRRRHL